MFSLVTKLLGCISHINNVDIVVIFKLTILQQNVSTIYIKLYYCLEINQLFGVVTIVSVVEMRGYEWELDGGLKFKAGWENMVYWD